MNIQYTPYDFDFKKSRHTFDRAIDSMFGGFHGIFFTGHFVCLTTIYPVKLHIAAKNIIKENELRLWFGSNALYTAPHNE